MMEQAADGTEPTEGSPWDHPQTAPEDQPQAKKATQTPRLRMGADHRATCLSEVARRHHAHVNDLPLGPRVFLPTLANEIGGYFPPGVVVLGGSPGCGKTSLAHQAIASAGCAAVCISLEMSPTVLIDRHISRATGRWLSELRSGAVPPEEWGTLFDQTMQTMPHLGFIDGSRGSVGRKTIVDAAHIAREAAQTEHLILVIDSFHSWMRAFDQGNGSNSDPRANMERSLHGIGQFAVELNATVLLITEQSKAAMDSDRQESSADSRVFAYISELVLMMSRDREIETDAKGEVPVLMTIGKNRHGSPGRRINLQFCGGKMRFRENGPGDRTVTPPKPKVSK